MKRRITVWFLCLALIAGGFTGCQSAGAASSPASGQQSGEPAAPAPSAAGGEKLSFVMPTGSMGGGYYSAGTVMAELVNTNVDSVEMSIRAGGSIENIGLLETGEVKFGMAGGPDYVAALGGMPKDSDNICSVMVFSAMCHIITVPADSTATSISDLKGKKVQVGDSRTGQYLMNKDILDFYGLQESDFKCEYMAQGDAATAFNEGKLDANLVMNALPSSLLTQMATNPKGFKVLTMGKEDLQAFCTAKPYYSYFEADPSLFPAEAHVAEAVPLFRQWGELLVRADVDEEVVYQITKTLCENYDSMVEKYKGLAECTAENTVKETSFNLHPGAARYFKEIGLM